MDYRYVGICIFCIIFSDGLSACEPKISIITSIYKADRFIEGFLEDIVKQTVFDACELILINANSPGNEEAVIRRYLSRHSNIIYIRLNHDPGLYAVWNQAISVARGAYVTNANVDDRLHIDCYRRHAHALDMYPDIELVYSDFYVTYKANQSFDSALVSHLRSMPEFSIAQLLLQPLPNNHPMWRKSLHERCGMFDDSFKYAGDWEFWLRVASCGARFKKVPGILGVYYFNPRGLSTDVRHADAIMREEAEIRHRYASLYRANTTD